MNFRVGQLISARGEGNNRELFEVVYMDNHYIQAINVKQNGFVSFPRVSRNTFRLANDSDIQSFIGRYLKWHIIQNYSEGGQFKVSQSFVERL